MAVKKTKTVLVIIKDGIPCAYKSIASLAYNNNTTTYFKAFRALKGQKEAKLGDLTVFKVNVI